MGAVCSAGMTKQSEMYDSSSRKTRKLKTKCSFSEWKLDYCSKPSTDDQGNEEQREWNSGHAKSSTQPSTPVRSSTSKQRISFLEKAGERAVEVLDSIGTSVSMLNSKGVLVKNNKMSILAFEVANLITKGANLFESMSEENIQLLEKEVLESEGVKILVSTHMKELQSFAWADKREEFNVFSREVVRFGNQCKDPQWHKLDRFFSRIGLDLKSHKQPRMETEKKVQVLITLAQCTGELYQELNVFDRFNQDYRRKVDEMVSLNLPLKGEGLTYFQSELKQQKKLVKSLKRKSLWSMNLEEIVEKLVDIVIYLHQVIYESSGNEAVDENVASMSKTNDDSSKIPQRLGEAGLALHYANLINQINNIASRPTFLPSTMRETLYHGLPKRVKTSLRSRLNTADGNDKAPVSEVKAELEKTLEWIVPFATNTIRAHQGFGWVGEWANACNELRNSKALSDSNQQTRLRTLHYALRQKTDHYMVELLVLLHDYTSVVRGGHVGLKLSPLRTPSTGPGFDYKRSLMSTSYSNKFEGTQLSQQDRNLLQEVLRHRMTPGISKSLDLKMNKRGDRNVWVLSKSTGCSPIRDPDESHGLGQTRSAALDLVDGL